MERPRARRPGPPGRFRAETASEASPQTRLSFASPWYYRSQASPTSPLERSVREEALRPVVARRIEAAGDRRRVFVGPALLEGVAEPDVGPLAQAPLHLRLEAHHEVAPGEGPRVALPLAGRARV